MATSSASSAVHSSTSAASAASSGSTSSNPTQLEFHQAMSDFKVMFPDMDSDVIEAVLRANNGAVDSTIDHLLTMTADNEAEKALHASAEVNGDGGEKTPPPPEYPPNSSNNPPSYQQAVLSNDEGDLINLGAITLEDQNSSAVTPSSAAASGGLLTPPPSPDQCSQAPESLEKKKPLDLLSDLDSLGAAGGGASSSSNFGSSPRHAYSHPTRQEQVSEMANLSIVPTQQMLQNKYEENLRMREEVRTAGESVSASVAMVQYLEDERVALMLQNEEFMAELRSDQDFLSALAQESSVPSSSPPSHVAAMAATAATTASAATVPRITGSRLLSDEALFREKLKTMGKTSKRKFSQLASMFSRRKGGAKQLLGHAPAPSKDNLLLNAEPLVNPVDDDYDDEEESEDEKPPHSLKGSTSKGGGKYSSFS